MKYAALITILFSLLATSCYYDKEAELYPTVTCDTSDYKYSTVVKPIIDQNCSISGCHDAGTAGGGYNLTTYADAKRMADNGTLYGSITHSSVFVQMPKDRSQLATCQIAQIKLWIDGGAPNN